MAAVDTAIAAVAEFARPPPAPAALACSCHVTRAQSGKARRKKKGEKSKKGKGGEKDLNSPTCTLLPSTRNSPQSYFLFIYTLKAKHVNSFSQPIPRGRLLFVHLCSRVKHRKRHTHTHTHSLTHSLTHTAREIRRERDEKHQNT